MLLIKNESLNCSIYTKVSYSINKLNFTGQTFSLATINSTKSFIILTF
ncbi:hypothetical protein FHR24_003133 [Wenyingzhuangia heitensis]|uniref:Uncharacterized protein n=1 Tax=Wenyingzhuangia heitensis TaxID=1487859 RepID=A0ABX0UDY4_9FLAO|nr:hypothetical protein [Wenyingzhuangia heitensis]